jgi:prevent-host-death family protein
MGITVDLCAVVIQSCITMKTATVRDLRNHFADVAKWIEYGEPVTITRNGTAFATLSPAKAEKPRKVDWAARLKRYKPVGRMLTKAETEAFWSSLRD